MIALSFRWHDFLKILCCTIFYSFGTRISLMSKMFWNAMYDLTHSRVYKESIETVGEMMNYHLVLSNKCQPQRKHLEKNWNNKRSFIYTAYLWLHSPFGANVMLVKVEVCIRKDFPCIKKNLLRYHGCAVPLKFMNKDLFKNVLELLQQRLEICPGSWKF